jgi:quinoprotein glucose dehydrogenase
MRRCISLRSVLFDILCICCLSARAVFGQAHGTNISEAELSVKRLEPATGLKVELFASEPLLQNPVAFSIDEKGRFFISETHRYKDSIFDITQRTAWLTNDLGTRTVGEREFFLRKTFGTNVGLLTKDSEIIRLVQDRDGDGRADSSSVFADGFNGITSGTAAGILARKGDVWFTCIPDLWKLQEQDGKVTKRDKMSTGYGPRISVSGHDLHGLALGPDGRIYFSCGDRGFAVTNREGRAFNYPETGGVLRCEPDGSNLEVFAVGLRNPQELAFDEFGNLFTDDNDTAGPDDSRVVYVVEGADYGWRAPYQYMEGYGPWCREDFWKGGVNDLLPYSGVVAHGPAGLAYYPGTGLREKFKGHFLVCDFPQGVKSFAVKPKGASYEVYDEDHFLKRLGATDVAFGPAGDVYVSDWGLSYTMPNAGRIYRVFDPTVTNSAAMEAKKLLAEGMENEPIEELTNLLAHADMRVRMEAQFVLAVGDRNFKRDQLLKWLATDGRQAGRALETVARHNPSQLARLHAIWGITQRGRIYADEAKVILDLLEDPDEQIRAAAAKAAGEIQWNIPTTPLLKVTHDKSPRARFFATMSLGKLKSKEATDDIVEMLRDNDDKDLFLTHAGVFALVATADDRDIERISIDPSAAMRRAALLCMREMQNKEISRLLEDSEPRLVLEAARAINDGPVVAAFPELAALLNNTNVLSESFRLKLNAGFTNGHDSLLRRAINANFRLGEASNAEALTAFANNETIPEALRLEALSALADWEKPDPRDRVVGMWRPLDARNKEDAETAMRNAISGLFQSQSDNVLQAVVHVLRNLRMNDTTILMTDFLTDTNRTPALRIESLHALVDLKHENLDDAVKRGLQDQNLEVRRESIKYVALVNAADAVKILEKLFTTEKDQRICQTILVTLGNLKDPLADSAIAQLMDQLIEGKILPELRLDLLEAAGKRSDPVVKEKLKGYEDKLAKDDALAAYRVALAGGDAELGKRIFQEREDVGCLRCHAIKRIGGTVGPDLGGISKRQPREYLLESVLFPNKQIAAGFENVVIVLKNGNSHAGLVKSETDTELLIESPEEGQVKIKKSEIEKRNRGLSPMPEEISKLLTKREVRDVVEYLSTLK